MPVPGSSRVILAVVQVIMDVIDHGMDIQEAVNAPRVRHEWLPDELLTGKGISPGAIRLLREMDYPVVIGATMGAASSILADRKAGMLDGAADPRREGSAPGC